MKMTFALLILGIAASAAAQQPRPVIIPRYRGQLTEEDARYTTGLNYDPFDAPFAWLPTGEMLIGHREVYSSGDVSSSTCAGTGFYAVVVESGATRPVAVGAPACRAAWADHGAAADPQGRWVVFSADVPPNNSRLLRFDLSTKEVDTLPTGCRILHDQPAVSRDGKLIAGRGLCRDRNENYYRVYVTASDGTGLRPLSTSEPVS